MKRPYSTLIREFTDNLDVRSNSRALYHRILCQFSQWVVIGGRNIRELKRSDILEYKASLLRDHKSENTIDSYLTVLRMFYDWCEVIGEHENIAAGIKVRHKRLGYRKEHLTTGQISKLYSVIETDTLIGRRDYAIINLMLRTGLRCVEVSRIRVCDIQSGDVSYVRVQRKGDNDRSEKLGLTSKVLQPITDYMSYRGVSDNEEYVFISHRSKTESTPLIPKTIGKIVASYLKLAGVYSRTITAHSLRHTAAVQALLHKVPPKEVQLMLGHRSVKTTEVYLKSIEQEIRLSNPAVQALDDAF